MTKPKTPGKSGRPKLERERCVSVTITVPPRYLTIARTLGIGNLSAGFRVAIDRAETAAKK